MENIRQFIDHLKSFNPKDKVMFDNNGSEWVGISYADFIDRFRWMALYLNSIGLKKGDRVGILTPPSVKWTIIDIATIAAGGITVPLFANISEENFVFECTEAQVKILFVGGKEQWALEQKHRHDFDKIISLDDSTVNKEAISFEKALEIGKKIDQENPAKFDELLNLTKPSDMASIVYSSGSTGVPKGIMLSQSSLFYLLDTNPLKFMPKERYLSILPLAHIFGRLMNYLNLGYGSTPYYFNDIPNVGQAFKEVKPHKAAVVPRLLEKVYAKMVLNVNSAHGLKKVLGKWALNLARKDKSSLSRKLFLPIADILVFKKFRQAIGGHINTIISGGAALNPTLCEFFNTIGIPVVEGYGLTEASIVSVNTHEKNKPGTVGALQKSQVKISEKGEILVKSGVMMMGYYNNPELTEKTIDKEGWLHTGDKGILDEDNYLKFLGRIKEFMKSSTGEYIAPVPIEQMLERIPFVDLSMVVGDNRKFVSALLFPNFEMLKNIKASLNQSHISDEEFLKSNYIKQEMEKAIKQINARLNHSEQIRAYVFASRSPSIQTGELTPSMKIRRETVMSKYKDLIDSMYPEDVMIGANTL